jgi:predicted GTPase
MPCGDLSRMRVQRFGSLADIDAASPSIEEREEPDVIVWDGGNNDTPFFRPTVTVCVLDPLRPGDGMRYHPGETNLVMADVVLVNKVDAATPSAVEAVISEVLLVNPNATVVQARSPVTLDPGPDLVGARVVVIEDGPTVTHGGMGHGAGLVAARAAGATVVDPRPWAVGSIAETFARHPHLGPVLPAMGYGDAQLAELGETIRAVDCDVVVTGTPMDLARVLAVGHPARRARYRVEEVGHPSLDEILTPWIKQWNPSNPG